MKGIILAGGTGTRLYPVTKVTSKQLLPIYDKPMIYYPLSVLMLAGIREILIITTPHDHINFINLLGDGSMWGITLKYKIQDSPDGLAQAFIIAEDFIKEDNVCMILGDNIFYGQGFTSILEKASTIKNGALIFGYKVKDPKRFGVVEFDQKGNVISIEEKPLLPKSDYAITGLYFFDKNVSTYAKNVKPSDRGELEITSILEQYLFDSKLNVELLSRGFAWLDTGTHESLIDAGQFVQTIEYRQGYKIACLEEIAYRKKWINREHVLKIADEYSKNEYGKYLIDIVKEGR